MRYRLWFWRPACVVLDMCGSITILVTSRLHVAIIVISICRGIVSVLAAFVVGMFFDVVTNMTVFMCHRVVTFGMVSSVV
jgi:hypothetical protein